MKLNSLFSLKKSSFNKYVEISPELEKISKSAFDYLNQVKPDIVDFAKNKKVKIKISPRKDYPQLIEEYNLDLFETSAVRLNKVKNTSSTSSKSSESLNKVESTFDVYPAYENNPQPFSEKLFSHLNLLVKNLFNKEP